MKASAIHPIIYKTAGIRSPLPRKSDDMLSADLSTSGVIVIDGTVPPSVASAGVPAVPENPRQRPGCMRNATSLHNRGTHSPSRCLANDQVDDTRLLLGIVRVHVGWVESNIFGNHD